ncbi:hypothetical protein C5167_030838 [Papaver somniferum]|nr:hypothetical protein C5167_030838 [Papaver somniferum]
MSTATFIDIILAIILPPLGVFLKFGCQVEFWICLVLTFLGYLPALALVLAFRSAAWNGDCEVSPIGHCQSKSYGGIHPSSIFHTISALGTVDESASVMVE